MKSFLAVIQPQNGACGGARPAESSPPGLEAGRSHRPPPSPGPRHQSAESLEQCHQGLVPTRLSQMS